MILVPGHNEAGNVLHIILGPESDLYADLHGAQVVDITGPLAAFNAGEPVHLSVTRTRSERETLKQMVEAGILVASSFIGKKGAEGQPGKLEKIKHNTTAKAHEKCEYCGQEKPLLSIHGFKICDQCVQIELGLAKQKRVP